MSEVQFNETPADFPRNAYADTPAKSKLLQFLESVLKKLGVPEEYTESALLAFVGVSILISLSIIPQRDKESKNYTARMAGFGVQQSEYSK